MFPEESKPYVLTIHGIRSRGEWQERSAPLLKPYYRPREFKYEEYLHSVLSFVWLALQPLAGVVGLALALAIPLLWHPFGNLWDWLLGALGLAVLWTLSGWLAARRLNRVAGKFATFWGRTVGFHAPPHVVAHSLGTFIAGTCLAKFEGIRAGTVIFNGCVLNRHFPWGDLRNAFRIRQVRNEIARKDWISRVAYLLHGSIPKLGQAGVFGFHAPPHTYTWGDPHRVGWYCEKECVCGRKNEGLAAFVHNVVYPELGHNDISLGPAHAIAFWLPALWGIPSLPYVQFRDLCIECRKAEREHLPILSELEAKLRNTCWGWTEGPLEVRLRRQIRSRLKHSALEETDIDDIVSLSVRNLWTAVANAVEWSDVENYAVNLNPDQALLNSVEATLVNANITAHRGAATPTPGRSSGIGL